MLVDRLGKLSGKPETSGLHIHPVANAGREHGGNDDEISVISSEQAKKIYADRFGYGPGGKHRQSNRREWHSDITFEPIPSDYTLLRLTQLPKTGGGELNQEAHPAQSQTTNLDIRHPLGLRLRGLRPHFAHRPRLPRHADGSLRPARIHRGGQAQRLRHLLGPAWRSRERGRGA